MNFTAMAAVVTAVAGLVLGAVKLAQDAAATRRLESLTKLREELPEGSLARKSVEEALDWTALKVVQKERMPLPQWLRLVGLGLYLIGPFGVMLSLWPSINIITEKGASYIPQGEELATFSLGTIGAIASFFISAAGLLLFTSFLRGRSRFRTLKRLRAEEEREIISTHSRHDLDARGYKTQAAAPHTS